MEAPPAVVVDAHDVCPDLDRAQEALREALGGSVAPAAGWRLRVFDDRRGSHYIVTAKLDDAQGNGVAHRVIDATASDRCDGVISALGVWAALVLDAEAAKARAHAKSGAAPAKTAARPMPAPGTDDAEDTPDRPQPILPPTGVVEPDGGAPQQHRSILEIGGRGTLQNSPIASSDAPALVGGDVFMLIEIVRSFFLRPAVAGAVSVGGATPSTYFSGRIDACLRVPGNYVEHRGLLLETCAGTEVGALDRNEGTLAHQTDAILAFGPTIGLRGDLASDLSVEVRGLADFNVAHTSSDIQLLSMRAELGLTWRLW